MQTIVQELEGLFRDSFIKSGIDKTFSVQLTESTRIEFGDYQVNGILPAAKTLKTNPKQLAQEVLKHIDLSSIASKIEIAGPGFINITLNNDYLANHIRGLTLDNKFGVMQNNGNIIIDLSSPNLSKEMHVGHLRSTVIGDSLAKILTYMGYTVKRQNHVGDWGTQFGMLIAHMTDSGVLDNSTFVVKDLEKFYIEAKLRFDSEPGFADKSRQYTVELQNWQDLHNDKIYKYWTIFRDASLAHCQEIYDYLGVSLTLQDTAGESFYQPRLKNIVEALDARNLIIESNGAKCIFLDENDLIGGEKTPFIVQKKDGGFLYSTTDLAAINYRVHELHADRIIYVVDARQSLHFKQLFTISKKANFAKDSTILEHCAFGTMMNSDGKPFKTRDGKTIKLLDLINEAVLRASKIVNERNNSWSDEDKKNLAYVLAIGAIKYADLSKNRTSDYIFSFEKMLSFDGNTAPYLLYAYTRIQSLLKKATQAGLIVDNQAKIVLNDLSEHNLALQISKFADMLEVVGNDCYPHYLCQYLYNLASLFMRFYESCAIIKNYDPILQQSRLSLANKTALLLKLGFSLLGIPIVDRM